MSSYSDYRQTTMPTTSAEEDFTLYTNYADPYSSATTYPSSTAYAEHYYAPPTSFDTYAPQYTYGNFAYGADSALHHSKPAFAAPSPSYSPANSTAHSFDHHPPVLSSTSDSGASAPSTISSAIASPSMNGQSQSEWARFHRGMAPGILHHETFHPDIYPGDDFEADVVTGTEKPACVDPSLIEPFSSAFFSTAAYTDPSVAPSPQPLYAQSASPAPHHIAQSGPIRTQRRSNAWSPYPAPHSRERRRSGSSSHSHGSRSQESIGSGDENRGVCPYPSCGRHIKDLKAHMLTHQNERPEKCPISICEYHVKGFARKYDKNRHTLTHYKGTMVCGFCPGSGSASEKSFNRADVFKRHLTSVHGVEQTAPNARRKSPNSGTKRGLATAREASGTCSTCNVTFASAQAFYEHLDDCVLRVVQQIDPSEATNERHLTSMAEDPAVQATLDRHMLSSSLEFAPTTFDQEDDENNNEDVAADVKPASS